VFLQPDFLDSPADSLESLSGHPHYRPRKVFLIQTDTQLFGMDPLSVTAGIIAILGAGGVVGKRVKSLIALESAPDELLILNNEISDLQYVLNDVQDLLRRQSDDHGAPVPLALTKALQRSRETVLALEKLIAYDLTVIDSRSKVPRVDKSRLLRAVKGLETYKGRIQRNRLEVSAASAMMAV